VAGRRPVEEAFVARRPAIRLLVVPQRRAALEKLVLHATNLRIPIVEVEGGSLTALAGFDGHQGVALVVEPRQFASLDDVLARAAERDEPPFILVLDSLEDPHNVGTLLRSAEAAGVHGVLFPTHRQAPLSPSAVKASAGAIEHLLLCPVDDLPGALSDLHARGVRVAGAEGDAPMTARQSDLRGPLAIVVGSEGQGLGPAVRRRCDLFMRIPMKGAVGSLNAAVAGSILLFEALAQRDPNATPSLPSPDAADPDGPGADSGDAAALPIGTPGSEPLAAPARKARKGLSTQPPEPDETAAAALSTGIPSTKPAAPTSAPKSHAPKRSATEPAPAGTQKPTAKRASPKPTTAKASPAKASPAKAASAKSAASKAAASPKAATAKSAPADPELATASAATPRPRKLKAPTSDGATPPAPDPGTVDDDLLPTDGARKRTRK
jgi:23S rRNA (guanosine2251-2'-O)-methyltransferase